MRGEPHPRDHDGWVAQLGVDSVRKRARAHLMAAGSPALPALRRGAEHRDPMVRRQCLAIFDHLVDDESVPVLVAALDDDDPAVCARALHALACDRCKQGECRPSDDLWIPVAKRLLAEHPHPDVRAMAVDSLATAAKRARPDVLDALRRAADSDPSRAVRTMAHQRTRHIEARLVRAARVSTTTSA